MRLPIFPLSTVLFPGGLLPLRIFETRYMDMARDCLRDESPFGVCLITRGAEVGQPAAFETIGCVARIHAWDMAQLGVLNVRAVGVQRLRVLSSHVREDRLAVGEVELIEPDEDAAPGPRHAPCGGLCAGNLEGPRICAPGGGGNPPPAVPSAVASGLERLGGQPLVRGPAG